jgi:hypothetical protein
MGPSIVPLASRTLMDWRLPVQRAPVYAARPRLADLLAALSVVTDLGHGQPPDDAMRACLLATRLATDIGLHVADRVTVYYTSLLRYVGCTAYAHEEAALFGGDEIAARRRRDQGSGQPA